MVDRPVNVNKASSLFGVLAVIAIAVVFIVNFQPGGGANQTKSGPDCAAHVLGSCIKQNHYWATYRLVEGGREDRQQSEVAQKRTLDALVERELLLAEAKRLGVSVGEDELSKELKAGRVRVSIPASRIANQQIVRAIVPQGAAYIDKKTNAFSPEAYKKAITARTGLSEEEFREYQRSEIVAERMREIIMSRVRVSESEAFDGYSAEEATAKVKFVRFHPRFYAMRQLDRTRPAMDAWADKNAAEIDKDFTARKAQMVEGCREVSHIRIGVPEGATEAQKKTAELQMEALRARIESGESFADVAREASDDGESAPDGGRLGCLMKADIMTPEAPKSQAPVGMLPPDFDEPVFGAKADGTLSKVIKSAVAFHLLRVDKIYKGVDAEKALRERVTRDHYYLAAAKKLTEDAAKEVQAAIKGGKTIEDALKEHLTKVPKLPARKVLSITPPNKPEPAPEPAPAPGDTPKGQPKGEPKKEDPKKPAPAKGDPKKEEPKKGDPKKEEPKKEEPPKVEEPKKEEPKFEEPKEDPLTPKVETSRDFTVGEEPFEGLMPSDSAAALAFALDKPGAVADKLLPLQMGGGLVLMALDEKKPPSPEMWEKERATYINKLRVHKQLDAYNEYMKRLRAAHTSEIKVNDEFFPKTKGSGTPQQEPPPE